MSNTIHTYHTNYRRTIPLRHYYKGACERLPTSLRLCSPHCSLVGTAEAPRGGSDHQDEEGWRRAGRVRACTAARVTYAEQGKG